MDNFVGDDDGLLADLFTFLERDESLMKETNQLVGESRQLICPSNVLGQTPDLRKDTACSTHPVMSSGTNNAGTFPTNRADARGNRGKRQRDADKVKELEALLAAKAEQYAKLSQHNADLKFKDRILSEAVMLREYQLHLVKGGTQLPARWFVHPTTAGSPQGTIQPSTFSGSVAQLIQQPGSVKLLCRPDQLPSIDRARFRSVTRLQLVAQWRGFLSGISGALLELEFNPEDELAATRLQRILAEVGSTYRNASVLAPDAMMGFLQTHMEDESLSTPEPGHWANVLHALQLTNDQLRDVVAMYNLFNNIMRGILQERKAITARLAAGLLSDTRAPVVQMTVPPEREVLPALERNMRKERVAHLLLRSFIFGRALSILQMGRAALHSYPFFPCATELAAAASGILA